MTATRQETTPSPLRRPFEEILTLACRAPSVHNTQPWLWRLHGYQLGLFADVSRHLTETDPESRDLMLSCGAVLHHVQVAARGLGWAPLVRRFPDPTNPRQLASITLEPTVPTREDVDEMLAVTARQTDRRRFTSWPVPLERLSNLAATGTEWGAQVVPVVDKSVRKQLRRLTRRADDVQAADAHYLAELSDWTTRTDQGVSPDSVPGPYEGNDDHRFPPGTLRDPAPDDHCALEGLLLVCTSSDDDMSRLRAGESMSAMWLQATRGGLAVVPLSQALEVEETRRVVEADVLNSRAFPQIILRVGWLPATRSPLSSSSRRDLSALLIRS
jgi:hypothetical protein